MAKLTEDVQTFIVQELACFRTPSEVAEAVKEEFGLVVSRQQVQVYDPEHGQKPAKKWCALHAAFRQAFLEQQAGLAITHRSWRMRELEDMARRAKKAKNYKLAAELLLQARDEMAPLAPAGGARPGEAPPESDEERARRIRAAIVAMDDRTLGPSVPTTAPAPADAAGAAGSAVSAAAARVGLVA